MLSHGKLDLSYFLAGPKTVWICTRHVVNTVFVHKLKQEGIEIALLVSHWLIFLTNQQTKGLAPNYNPK